MAPTPPAIRAVVLAEVAAVARKVTRAGIPKINIDSPLAISLGI
jgi:hypothetical protein